MKLLMIIPGLDKRLGGTTTLSIGFFDELRKLTSVTLVTTYTDQELDFIDDRFKNNPDVKLFRSFSNRIKYSSEQQKFLIKHINEYNLVHVHGLWHLGAYPASKLAMKKNIPYIISPHGMLEPDAMNRSKLKKQLFWKAGYAQVFKRANAIHCTAKNEISSTLRVEPTANTFLVPNGVNLPMTTYKKIPNQLLFIGRVHPKKGIDRLIEAFASLENSELKLIVAGTGDKTYESEIKELIQSQQLTNQIKLIGFVDGDQKQKLLAESQIVCVPSFSEGMPLVSLETMASGTPLLITKPSNVPEVSEYDCGLELENNEPKTIAEGIEVLLNSDLSKKAENAVNLVRSKFLWNKVARSLFDEYQKYIKN